MNGFVIKRAADGHLSWDGVVRLKMKENGPARSSFSILGTKFVLGQAIDNHVCCGDSVRLCSLPMSGRHVVELCDSAGKDRADAAIEPNTTE